MIHDLVLPQLAMGMSEGTVVEWSVPEGGHVERDATLLALETEKVITDLPAPRAGWVHHVAAVGEKLPVETLIARIADTEAEYRSLLADGSAKPAAITPAAAAPAAASAPVSAPVSALAPATAPAAIPSTAPVASKAAALGAVASVPAPTASDPAAATRIKASGLARKLASDHGIDLRQVPGSGPGGRIVRRDLFRPASSQGQPAQAAATGATAIAGSGMRVRATVPMSGMRRAIAERMVQAKTTAAHTYAFFELDVTKLEAARETMLAREKELGGRISMIALYAKGLALACRHVAICNATIADDQITVWDNVNIGIAVALPGKTEYESGLLVPVVRDVQSKGLVQLSNEIKDLVTRARAGSLSPAEMAGGTVTMSSTGGFVPGQWVVSTPLLNQPQVLNFQPGTPLKKPVVVEGDQIAVRSMLPCGLSFDHRAMDGEPIGRFVNRLTGLLTHPELMLA